MSTAFKWIELFLQNSKVIGGLLIILMSGLGFSTWTVFDQQQEIVSLKQLEVKVVKVPVPVELKKLKKDVKELQVKMKRWHE